MPRRSVRMLSLGALLTSLAVVPQICRPAELRPETVQAFNHYVAIREGEMDREAASEKTGRSPGQQRLQEYAALRRGEIAIHKVQSPDSANKFPVPGGLIHDWTGSVFVPGASISQTLALLQDYDHDDAYYRPEVLKSK